MFEKNDFVAMDATAVKFADKVKYRQEIKDHGKVILDLVKESNGSIRWEDLLDSATLRPESDYGKEEFGDDAIEWMDYCARLTGLLKEETDDDGFGCLVLLTEEELEERRQWNG